MSVLEFLEGELAELERAGLRRSLRTVDGPQGREINLDRARVLNFCSNNYLGLADSPTLRKAAAGAIAEAGTGAGASRLIGGTQRGHVRLEAALAQLAGTQAALLFSSGYQANIGVISALLGPDDAIFSDALNHASIIDGCRLSRAKIHVFPHGNVAALDQALTDSEDTYRRRMVVTESVFSMDGDTAALREISECARRHEAILMVDEAHALGVFGPRGAGLTTESGVEPDVRVGTLGKALGSFGAFVAGSAALIELLLNRARSFVFTTALPPPIVAASLAAVDLVRGDLGESRRQALRARIAQFAEGLAARNLLQPGAGTTPIFPVALGDNRRALECSELLLNAGVYAQAIRPPTVPVGTARIRFALSAVHTPDDLERALSALDSCVDSGLLEPCC